MKTKVLFVSLLLGVGPVFAQDGTYTETETTVTETTDTTANRPVERGLFLEPMLTYTREESSIEATNTANFGGDQSADANGIGVGLRVGGHVGESFFLGLDGRYSRLELSDSAYGNAEGDSYNIGPVVGLQMPTLLGLRVWGTYVLAGEFDPETGNGGLNVRFEQPEGWRVGAGIKLASMSLNVEYQDLSFDRTDIQSLGTVGTAATDVDFDLDGYTFSLSFPLEL